MNFWDSRRVFLTGHTGFKGSWLALWLHKLGADVVGYALDPPTNPSLFNLARIGELVTTVKGDTRDLAPLEAAVRDFRPEVVIHLAAQPLVHRSYADPVETYTTNVLGTVNLLEAVRRVGANVVVNVTTDKVYENPEHNRAFREDEPKGGRDPYSSSKACSEFVAAAYRESFAMPISTARAGNVIGGGDWSKDRLVPDLMRGTDTVQIRSPDAIRPWQHVLNPLSGYLRLAEAMWESSDYAGAWNFGPDERDEVSVRHVADRLSELRGVKWEQETTPWSHEAQYLRLDSSKARTELGWEPRWDLEQALVSIAEWYEGYERGEDPRDLLTNQIESFQAVPV